ncbi:MAG: hypothetical protein D3908_08920 [Candidatus Electrothrix sp. AUS4]|nr:hypothetical protein [Candidatus Electrothrix sp. AUS4]
MQCEEEWHDFSMEKYVYSSMIIILLFCDKFCNEKREEKRIYGSGKFYGMLGQSYTETRGGKYELLGV